MTDFKKAIGLPLDMDEEHEYRYYTGFHEIRNYWWIDRAGNYWKYTNAPEGSADFNPHLGEPMIHPEQPLPTTNPEYFTEDGLKRHQAVAPGLIPQRNPDYDAKSPKELWFEVVESAGLTRYIYLDADVRENLDLWVQYQLRLADAGLLQYRKYAYDLFNGDHPKDKVTGVILMLLDQGLFLPEHLIDLTVADMEFIDKNVKLGGKKVNCDDALWDFFTSLSQDRTPEDPLFVLQTVHGRNSLGYNYIYSVLDNLKMDPNYLLAWHANHVFSKVLHRMSLDGLPLERASVEVYEEVAKVFSTTQDIRFMIDTKVKNILLENYEQDGTGTEGEGLPEEPVEKALVFEAQDSFGVPAIFSDLIDRRGDELEFSIWLHSEPMHDISPAEEERIEAAMAEVVAQQEDASEAPPAAPEGEGGEPDPEAPEGAPEGQDPSPSPEGQ